MEASEEGTNGTNVNANEREKTPPVIWFQADLARFLGRWETTPKLAEKLLAAGILREFTKPSKHKGKYHFWFADATQHQIALLAAESRYQ